MKCTAKQLASAKAYRQQNKEKVAAGKRAYWLANQEKARAYAREYKKKPEVKNRRRIRESAPDSPHKAAKKNWHQANKPESPNAALQQLWDALARDDHSRPDNSISVAECAEKLGLSRRQAQDRLTAKVKSGVLTCARFNLNGHPAKYYWLVKKP